MDVDDLADDVELNLPAHELLMGGGVEKRPGGDGVDVTAVEGTGVVRLGSTAEGSDGLPDVAVVGPGESVSVPAGR